MKKSPNRSDMEQSDIDRMLIDYLEPNMTLRDIAKKYKLSLNAVYFISRNHKWSIEKKAANETAFLDAVAVYIKKRKDSLVKDLDKISGIEDKVFEHCKSALARGDMRVGDMCALIKLKYDLIAKFGTNKQIIEQNIQEGDTNFNINLTDSEIEMKVVNLVKDLKINKTKDNRLKALKGKLKGK